MWYRIFALIVLIPGLIAAVVFFSSWHFNRFANKEIQSLLNKNPAQHTIVTENALAPLPAVVRKWLRRSGVPGQEMIRTVHLHQVGQMRLKPDVKWMTVKAEQFSTVQEPGFVWLAKVQMAPMLFLRGRDKYENGKGEMLIQLLSTIPVVNAKGNAIDQGALVRYLAEIVWFPSAALTNYMKWEQISDTAAKATMSYKGLTGSGIFLFTSDGDWQSFEGLRYYDRKTGATLETWHVEADPKSFKLFQGLRIPAKSSVTWKLKEGDFTWFEVEIVDVKFNEN